jgi:LCP family protein required for cell wall assembly
VHYRKIAKNTEMHHLAFDTQGNPVSYSKKRFFSVAKYIGMAIILGVFVGGGVVFVRIDRAISTISVVPSSSSNPSVLGVARAVLSSQDGEMLRGEELGRVNILLLGKTGKGYPGKDLTDTIMVASVDVNNRRFAMLSIPRDTYIPLSDGVFSKINTIYASTKDANDSFLGIRDAVSTVTGLPIHYVVLADYDGFKQVVDAVGGVHVMVDRDIYDTRFPGPHYSYETFSLSKGFHKLDGETALKYVRERHSDPLGDFGRAARQQQVIQSLRDAVMSAQTFLNPIAVSKLLESLEENIRTDIPIEALPRVIALAKETDLVNVETVVLDAWKPESLLRVSHMYTKNGQRMFTLVPRVGTFEEIHEVSERIFDLSYLANRLEKIKKEEAGVVVRYENSRDRLVAETFAQILLDAGFSRVITTLDSGESREITTVSDNTEKKKPYALDEIIRLSGAKILPEEEEFSRSEESYDFVITIGEDIRKRYDREIISPEEYRELEQIVE